MDKKKVLMVDDDVDIAKMLKIRIEGEGYEFMSAVNGKEMLDILKIKKPDVILLDIMLPAIDGYSLLREMRKYEEYADIPVIILSAKEKKKVGDLFILEKIAFFVEKPFDTKDLMEKIRISMGDKKMNKKRILIVDDEEDILNVLRFRLEANNYEVLLACDGQEGLDKARSEKPDLILLDLMLPKIDGYKVCRMLKFDKNYSAIPIIMVTAKAQKEDKELGDEMGADAYVPKPFDTEALLGKIKELLDKTLNMKS